MDGAADELFILVALQMHGSQRRMFLADVCLKRGAKIAILDWQSTSPDCRASHADRSRTQDGASLHKSLCRRGSAGSVGPRLFAIRCPQRTDDARHSQSNELPFETNSKGKPLQKTKETNGIFENIKTVRAEAEADPETLEISIDTKTKVKLGKYSMGGKHELILKATSRRHLIMIRRPNQN